MKRICLSIMFVICSSLVFAEDVTKIRIVKEFFKKNSDLRVSQDAVVGYKKHLAEISLIVIQRATELAKGDNRKTVLERDLEQATDEVFRRSPMTVDELMEKIKQLPIVDLTELSNQVKAYGDELLKKKKK